MKNYYFPLLALLAFTACENSATNSSASNSNVSNSEPTQVVETSASAQPTDDSHTEQAVAQRVMSIYDFNRPNKGGSCCSKHWEYLVSAVDAKVCDGYYGYFEYDYWIMGQDYVEDIHISDVKVEKLEGDFAEVSFVLHNFEPLQMAVELVYENNDWFVDNIINKTQNLNLKNDMESFLKK